MNGLLSRSETIKIKRYEKDCCVFSSILRFSGRDKFHGKVVLPMLAFLFGIWFQEVAAQSRICLINGGRYSANLNEILPSLQSGYMQTLGMHDSYRAIFSYISVEEYIFSRGNCHKRKTGLQNARCAQAVADELRVYFGFPRRKTGKRSCVGKILRFAISTERIC